MWRKITLQPSATRPHFELSRLAIMFASVCLALGLCKPASGHEIHTYRNYNESDPPGYDLPAGPDEYVRLIIKCPTSSLPGTAIVLPAGASNSSFTAIRMSAPLYHYISLNLSQDYAVSPTRILWRLSFSNVGLSGYIGPKDEVDATFNGPDCSKPWHMKLTSTPMSGAYKPGTLGGFTPSMKPFPDEK